MAYRRGHVTGHKRERLQPAQPWYAAIEEAACQQAETAWQAVHRTDETNTDTIEE